jgi:hypothetical protein
MGVGCTPTPNYKSKDTEMGKIKSPKLIGIWAKTTRTACAALYPDTIVFKSGGLYHTLKPSPDKYTIWDVGTYESINKDTIKISTATDEIIAYPFNMPDENTLAFKDLTGCQFLYKKQ